MDHHTIGEMASKAIVSLTDSSPPAEKPSIATPTIRLPETADECRALREWAETTNVPAVRASVEQISRHLEFLAATLPSKNVDENAGKMRFSVYYRMLGGYSDAALSFMSREICKRFDWFPTPHQCLGILEEYRPQATPQELAITYCQQFWQQRFENFVGVLKGGAATQEMIDGVPDQWRRIAVEQGHLRRMPDGSHVIRKRTQIA